MERYSKLTEWLKNPRLIVLSFEQIESTLRLFDPVSIHLDADAPSE
jgi:hypothetical protein